MVRDVAPGSTTTFDFTVNNAGNIDGTQDVLLVTDDGTRATVDQIQDLSLNVNETSNTLSLVWDVPRDQTEGLYDVTIETEDDSVVSEYRVRNARAIPDSVVYQYDAADFTTSSWPDTVGSADMSVTGLSDTTFSNGAESVDGDGTDDYGTANGPEDLAKNTTFGLALTIRVDNVPQFGSYFGMGDDADSTSSRMQLRDSGDGNGDFELFIQDNNGGSFSVNTDPTVAGDGTVHAVVVNKNGNSDADVNFYIDDMATAVGTAVDRPGSYDPSNWSSTYEMAFYARNDGGAINRYVDMAAGVFEFNTAPYSQTEREDFVSRRPEV